MEHGADGVPVAGGPQLDVRQLLGGHVGHGPGDGGGGGAAAHGEAEVDEHDVAVAGGEDVRGLDVPVQEPGPVDGGEAVDQAMDGDAQPLEELDRELRSGELALHLLVVVPWGLEVHRRPADAGGEALLGQVPVPHVLEEGAALDEVHGEQGLLAVDQQLVQAHHVGMEDVGEAAELLAEPHHVHGAVPVQPLQGDGAAPLVVAHLLHQPARPGPQDPQHLEALLGAEAHGQAAPSPRVTSRAMAWPSSLPAKGFWRKWPVGGTRARSGE